jgi:hypothetical protein
MLKENIARKTLADWQSSTLYQGMGGDFGESE